MYVCVSAVVLYVSQERQTICRPLMMMMMGGLLLLLLLLPPLPLVLACPQDGPAYSRSIAAAGAAGVAAAGAGGRLFLHPKPPPLLTIRGTADVVTFAPTPGDIICE